MPNCAAPSKKPWQGKRLIWVVESIKKTSTRTNIALTFLAKGGEYWVYEYLFAKNDRDNIDDAELEMFRTLAKGYERLTRLQLTKLIAGKLLLEICHDDEKKV